MNAVLPLDPGGDDTEMTMNADPTLNPDKIIDTEKITDTGETTMLTLQSHSGVRAIFFNPARNSPSSFNFHRFVFDILRI